MRKHIRSLTAFCIALVLSCLLLAGGCWGDVVSDYKQGVELYDACKYVEAIVCFKKALADPEMACVAQYQVGLCHQALGMLDAAIPALNKALSMAKEGELAFDIRTSLAQCCVQAKLWDEASSVIQQIALIAPEYGGHMLFMSCVDQRDYERAAAALIYSLVTTPGIEHIGSKGLPSWLLYSSDRKSVKAYVQSFCDVVSKGAMITVTYQIRADLQAMLEKCGQTDGAAAVVYSTFLEKDTLDDRAEKVCNLAGVYSRGGKHKEAAKLLADMLNSSTTLTDSHHVAARYRLGLSYRKIGDSESAKRCMQEIVDYYPSNDKAQWAQRHLDSWAKADAGK